MTNDLPAYLTWPVLAAMMFIIAVRYRWFNGTLLEHHLNNALMWLLISNVLRDRTIEGFLADRGYLSVVSAHQLALAAAVMSAAEFLFFIGVWADREKYRRRNHYRLRRLEALTVAALLLATGTPARLTGQTLEANTSWWSVAALTLLGVYFTLLATEVIRMALWEWRQGRKRPREKAVIVGMIAIAAVIAITSLGALLLKVLDQLHLVEATEVLQEVHGQNFFAESILEFGLAAIPLVLTVARMAAWDYTSRSWRALQPLRRDLQAVAPLGMVMIRTTGRRKSLLQLHQTEVAILDSVFQLTPYMREPAPERAEAFFAKFSVPPDEQPAAVQALLLAEALGARLRGELPEGTQTFIRATRELEGLEDQTEEILRAVKWWPAAKSFSRRGQPRRWGSSSRIRKATPARESDAAAT